MGISYTVVGKYFQELELHRGMKHIQELNCEKMAKLWLIHVFCKILDSLSNFVYVNKKFCNKKLIQTCLILCWKVFPDLYCLHKMYRGGSIEFIEFRVFRKKRKRKLEV